MCLTVPGTKAASGSKVDLTSCSGAARQQWQPWQPEYSRAISASLGTSPTTLINPWSRMCLAVTARATGTRAVIRSCAGTAAQRWTVEPDGTMRVRGRCLEVNRQGKASGTPAGLHACNGTGAQLWHLTPRAPASCW